MCMYVCGFVYVGHKWDFMKSIDRPHCYTREQKEWKTGCGGGTHVFLLTPTHRNPSTSLARCFRRCCSGSSLFVRLYMQIEGEKTVHFKRRLIPGVFLLFCCVCLLPGQCEAGLLASLPRFSVSPVFPLVPGTSAESACHWSDSNANHPHHRKHTPQKTVRQDTHLRLWYTLVYTTTHFASILQCNSRKNNSCLKR